MFKRPAGEENGYLSLE